MLIIAEIGQAHEGSLGIAHSYIDALADTGVDIIKFQTHIAEAESSPYEPFRVKFSYEDSTRFETMATAVSAAYMNIPLAHIQGGEVTGNIDKKVRHSITKLADYHFVASESARQRVIKLGENPHYVFNTGCPSIDLAHSIKSNPSLNFDPYKKYGGVGSCPDLSNGYIVVMQHPVTTEYAESRTHIEETLYAIKDITTPILWFWPNVYAGADGTSTGIRSFRETHRPNNLHFFKNMEGEDFLRLLLNSKCLIGNSSVGIRECAYLGVPVVNIGTRQIKRDRGNNIKDVNYDRDEIRMAVLHWFNDAIPIGSDVYGGGDAGKKIADLLGSLPLKFHKTINY
ncbi:MAG: UDP-N-acetylglucosamine 2-epimerase (hydrolyzing) [Bacteroidia bacterium]|nr:UDP-N-acetylglucosamine 2-epimerase (hydrolyzing) [Bacteroidia bacterium]